MLHLLKPVMLHLLETLKIASQAKFIRKPNPTVKFIMLFRLSKRVSITDWNLSFSGVSYLKSYYKGADVYPNGETVPRLNSSYGSYSSYEPSLNGAGSSSGSLPGNIHSPYQISSNKPSNPTSAWLSHHRQSVVVWNNGSRQTEQPSNFKPSSSAWSATGHGETGRSVYSRLQPSAFSSTSSDGRQSGSTRGLQEEKVNY